MLGKILIVDDEIDMLELLKRILADKFPHQINTTTNPLEVSQMLAKEHYDIVVTDLKMPQLNGIQVLESVRQKDPTTAVIIMTAYGSIESAIEATRKGAFDYITKPFRKERILHVIEKALKWQQMQRENLFLREKLDGHTRFPLLLGTSPVMERLQLHISRVAKTSATVLITGESGTGKELVARTIHSTSSRKEKAFIAINCSTIPETIIESELFGHLKGSFTGAIRDKKGLVEEADQGTLFLDEIGDLSFPLQVKLLRLIQEGEYKPLGSNSIRKVDIRFIAATNQNLSEKIKKGEFREDLYYRLNVINIHLPPLRERREDIPILARHFLHKYNALHGKNIQKLTKEAVDYLQQREWPGNIRELENVMERGVIMSAGEVMELADLLACESCGSPLPPVSQNQDLFTLPFKEAKDKLLEQFHAQYIANVLTKHGGNVSQAARDSGLKRQYLHRLMKETNTDSKAFRKPNQGD